MPKVKRTPISVNRTRALKGGVHVPTVEGLLMERDYCTQEMKRYQTEINKFALKVKRAEMHRDGEMQAAEFLGMTALQLDRAIKSFEASWVVACEGEERMKREISRINKLLS